MSIVDHNRDHIINLLLIANVNSFVMNEQQKTFLYKSVQNSIHSGITTVYIKHAPIITLGTAHNYIFNPQFSSSGSLNTENSKSHNPKSHTNLHWK